MTWVEFFKDVVSQAGAPAAIVLTAWVALRRFRSEKWWERKAETYASVFDAMTRFLKKWIC